MATLRFMTFNVWDIPVSQHRTERVDAIVRCLRDNVDAADVVGLIECWLEADRARMIQAAREAGLVHHVFFRNGCGFPGGHSTGLVLLSRFPITNCIYHRFSAAGKAQKLLHWDYSVFSGKGIGKAELQVPGLGAADVYMSHFVAYYTPRPEDPAHDEYALHRHLGAWEAGQFIRATARPGAFVACLTDLNAAPDTLTYDALRGLCGLRDAWRDAGRARQSKCDAGSDWDAEAEAQGLTVNYPGNRYHDNNAWIAKGEPSSRVDFVLYAAPAGTELEWCERRHAEQEVLLRGEGQRMSLSDHAAVLASFRLGARPGLDAARGSKNSRSSSSSASTAVSDSAADATAADADAGGSSRTSSLSGGSSELLPSDEDGAEVAAAAAASELRARRASSSSAGSSGVVSAAPAPPRALLARLLTSADAGVVDALRRRQIALRKARVLTLCALLSALLPLALAARWGWSQAAGAAAQLLVGSVCALLAMCYALLAHVAIPDEESAFIAFGDNLRLQLAAHDAAHDAAQRPSKTETAA